MSKKPTLKMKRITTADLIYNGMPFPIDTIEIESDELWEHELKEKISEIFMKKMVIRFDERFVKK
jgi:hypothetical protein